MDFMKSTQMGIENNKFFLTTLMGLLFGISAFSYSQAVYVFKDDSLLNQSLICPFENIWDQPYRCIKCLDLKEKLPDGEYIVVDINRTDTSRMDLQMHTTSTEPTKIL